MKPSTHTHTHTHTSSAPDWRKESLEAFFLPHTLPLFQETIVLRGGKKLPLPVNQVVLGDIVDVKFGDRAPADIRIIRSAGLKVCSYLKWVNFCTQVSYYNGTYNSLVFLQSCVVMRMVWEMNA